MSAPGRAWSASRSSCSSWGSPSSKASSASAATSSTTPRASSSGRSASLWAPSCSCSTSPRPAASRGRRTTLGVVRIGVLTGGGDAPGLNAAIRGVARRAFQQGFQVSGIKNGWAGVLGAGDIVDLTPASVRGILPLGGTILGTSRTNPLKEKGGVEQVTNLLRGSGADMIIIPEFPAELESVVEHLHHRRGEGKDFSIIVVAEGVKMRALEPAMAVAAGAGKRDAFGHVQLAKQGVGDALSTRIEEATGFETRVTVLGHLQRGGSPSPVDRIWATRLGVAATDLLADRKAGVIPIRRDGQIAVGPLRDVIAETRRVPRELYDLQLVFG